MNDLEFLGFANDVSTLDPIMYQYFLQHNKRPLYLTGEHRVFFSKMKKNNRLYCFLQLPIVPVMLERKLDLEPEIQFL